MSMVGRLDPFGIINLEAARNINQTLAATNHKLIAQSLMLLKFNITTYNLANTCQDSGSKIISNIDHDHR